MKKYLKVLLIILVLTFMVYAFIVLRIVTESPSVALIKDKERIQKVINKKYPSYKMDNIELEYVDWSSSVRSANNYHKATSAKVTISNETEQRFIILSKKIYIWIITFDVPNSGPNIPNDVYYFEFEYKRVYNDVDIEEYIKNEKYLIFRDDINSYYKKIGNDDNWYYSVKYCKNIYKTKDGKVYVFNKNTDDWELSNETYSNLNYISNYYKVDKSYAIEMIEKNSSYREN